MATPEKHAVCSASASERWLNCTAAPRLEEKIPESTSTYAEEGRLAHSFCEVAGKARFGLITKRKYTSITKKLKEDPLFSDEMIRTSDFYAQYLYEKSMEFSHQPFIAFEVRVDFSRFVPEGFGTCDCVMLADDTLRITDYKHGKGVWVPTVGNTQMRLYALGYLETYKLIYGDSIKKVVIAIVQPRLSEDVEEEKIDVKDLYAWGESIAPTAAKAFSGFGVSFVSGEWCRFCRAKVLCRARADRYSAFEDFKDVIFEGSAEKLAAEEDISNRPVISDAEVGDLLIRGSGIVDWFNDLREYAVSQLLSGKEIPGWKLVEGRSDRAFTDADAAIQSIIAAGYTEEQCSETKPKSLAKLEKMIGVKRFAEIAGSYVYKPPGKPTLAELSDKRETYKTTAALDFAGVGNGG